MRGKRRSLLTRLGISLGLIREKAAIIVVGLDNSGKTTLLKRLRVGLAEKATDVSETAPTIGFGAESFRTGNVEFACFDMAGQEKYRPLWERYYSDVEGVIFVCDAADRMRMCVARDELETMLGHADIVAKPQLPILFFANKVDLMEAMEPVEVMSELGLELIEKPWHICACSATTGMGVQSGVEWLAARIRKAHK
jgi:ADP-ribosylation factor-like protein 6